MQCKSERGSLAPTSVVWNTSVEACPERPSCNVPDFPRLASLSLCSDPCPAHLISVINVISMSSVCVSHIIFLFRTWEH